MNDAIFVHPDPAGHPISLARAESTSAKLAVQLSAAVARFMANRRRWPQAPATVRTLLTRLLPRLSHVVSAMPDEHQARFRQEGLDALESEECWAYLEAACHQTSGESPRLGKVLANAFLTCTALYWDEPDLRSPSVLRLRARDIDVSELYRASAAFLLTYRRLILEFDAGSRAKNGGIVFKHNTYSLLVRLLRDRRISGQLRDDGFEAFALHPSILRKAESVATWQQHSPLLKLLSLYDGQRWGRGFVTVYDRVADLSELHRFSPAMYADVVKHAARLGKSPPAGIRATSTRDSLTQLQRALPRLPTLLSTEDLAALKERGFVALVEGDCRRLAALYARRHLARGAFGPFKEIVDSLFPELKRDSKELEPYNVTFTNRYAERPTYCDFGGFRDLSVRFYDDLVELVGHIKGTLDDRTYAEITVYHQFTQLRAAMALCRPQLSPELLRSLQWHGLQAFNRPGLKLQKAIFEILQRAWRSGTVATATAWSYRNSVVWLATECGFSVVDAYPISQSKTARHLRRLNTDDYYSADQCRELAFHVEGLLADAAIGGEARLALMLARVLLKTGWNLSATLEIECGDIVRSTSPLNPRGPISVILFKRRGGYRADAYTFDEPHTSVAAMASAAADLMQVRDELTAGLRASLPDGNPYKDYVFLFEKEGSVQRLPMAAPKVISGLLARCGCTLTFDTKKIRKGGVNHMYRQVQKDLQAYEASAKHDFATFEAHYHRFDPNQARYSLGKAVDVMGRYFSGKEISKDIIIITRSRDDLQHTPIGECASMGVDREAALYNLEHKRLHAERGTVAKFCADFLGCIWCKFFRLVADPDHVWRLLSYRDFVLQSMQVSVLGDPADEQQTHVGMLKARVAEMLERLDSRTPGVIAKAAALQRDNGMHPAWTFALADVQMR